MDSSPSAVARASADAPSVEGGGGTVPLFEATVADLGVAFRAGTLTSERLVSLYLDRIAAYDRTGPSLNAVLSMAPDALEQARELDRERAAGGPRSALHGIPVVIKDNIDTADLPTTGGSLLLAGSVPPDDAFVVRRLREAGAIVLAKVNMSEFASAAPMSSLQGPMRNPHDLTRTPSGSSGGTGVAVAAAFAQFGVGTDTGGSIRGPARANGVVGLKPTLGLVSRDGIIPLALAFDTAGPIARNVADVAAALEVMVGEDPSDPATSVIRGQVTDYRGALDVGALAGARIGVARDFMGADAEVDWVVEAALETMRRKGATVVDVRYPKWLLEVKADWYRTIRYREFRAQIEDYLATLAAGYPRTLDEMIERSQQYVSTTPSGGWPNPRRWSLFRVEAASGSLTDHEYLAARTHGLAHLRAIVEGILEADGLDAIVYPTSPCRPVPVGEVEEDISATNLANLTGFPDLTVPAGFTGDMLPVGLSFSAGAFSEPKLLALGYAFEQATRARRDPRHTPPLAGEDIDLPEGLAGSEVGAGAGI